MKKRLLSILLAGALAVGGIFGSSLSAGAAAIPGDTDGNGKVETNDVTLIQRHLSHMILLDNSAQKISDVDGNGTLEIYDATLIQRRLAKMIPSFPVEDKVSKVKDIITIRFTDNKKWGNVHAHLYNYTTGETLAEYPGVPMIADGKDSKGNPIYKLDVDVSKYDRVVFNNGAAKQSIEIPVTKASYSFHIDTRNAKKYDVDLDPAETIGKGTIETLKMDFPGYPEGEQKTVWVYLPEGYDPADTAKKYSVLYMDDGQVMLGTLPNDDWRCDKTVRSLMNNGGDGIIIVGISSLDGDRNREMCPFIGKPIFDPEYVPEFPEDMTEKEILEEYEKYCLGGVFADFTVNTVIPYIESHYNVNSIRGFTGSSGGGLEAFYIGMEYPKLFDYVGVMSPSLNVYDASVWNEYLDTKNFSGKVPRMYFFCGNSPRDQIEQALYPYSIEAEGWLKAHNYPTDRVRTVTNADTIHLHKYWGLYLPELFSWGLEL